MHRSILLLSLATMVAWTPAAPAQNLPPPPPLGPVPATPMPKHMGPDTPRTYDWTKKSIYAVLRQLAHDGGFKIVVADGLNYKATMRMVDQTPKQAMMIVVKAANLGWRQGQDGIYYIHP